MPSFPRPSGFGPPTPRSNRRITPIRAPSATGAQLSLSEILSALSYALDLTEGQPPGHTIRSCIIGMRLGEEIGLGQAEKTALYFALLLKDAGCSSNAARMASLFGSDDHLVKQRMKLVDWHRAGELAVRTAQLCGVGQSVADRVRYFLGIARTENVTRDIMQLRCERGAEIASGLGFPDATAAAIRALDEHWCGLGHPSGLKGEEIPLLARIATIAQTVDVFHVAGGMGRALDAVRKRRGSWFDPRLARLVLDWRRDVDFWQRLSSPAARELVVALEPGGNVRRIDADGLDGVARAFAEIIDAKSPYTARHSLNVAAYARRIAHELGVPAAEERRIFRAGLLHDIGKLGVSNRILDKAGALDIPERAAIEQHPRHTWDILQRVDAFGDFAWLASVHHEKLDGSGYPWGLRASELDQAARILAVADIYEALSADRPYRAGMPRARALEILHRERGVKLCETAVDGLEAAADDLVAPKCGGPAPLCMS